MNKIINRQWHFFGYEINVRILPPEFRYTIERLDILIKDRAWSRFNALIEEAYKKWGSDEDLVYRHTWASAEQDQQYYQ